MGNPCGGMVPRYAVERFGCSKISRLGPMPYSSSQNQGRPRRTGQPAIPAVAEEPAGVPPLGGERGRTCRVGPGLHPVQTFWARDGRNLLNNAQLRRLKAELQQPTNTTVDTVINTNVRRIEQELARSTGHGTAPGTGGERPQAAEPPMHSNVQTPILTGRWTDVNTHENGIGWVALPERGACVKGWNGTFLKLIVT